jgi:hypothetical protein
MTGAGGSTTIADIAGGSSDAQAEALSAAGSDGSGASAAAGSSSDDPLSGSGLAAAIVGPFAALGLVGLAAGLFVWRRRVLQRRRRNASASWPASPVAKGGRAVLQMSSGRAPDSSSRVSARVMMQTNPVAAPVSPQGPAAAARSGAGSGAASNRVAAAGGASAAVPAAVVNPLSVHRATRVSKAGFAPVHAGANA